MIHGLAGVNKVPLVSFLLTDKCEETYDLMMSMLSKDMAALGLSFHPDLQVHCDYEIGLRNALKKAITQSTVVGCLFHFSQAINRKCDSTMKCLRNDKGDKNDVFRTWLDRVRHLPLCKFIHQKP